MERLERIRFKAINAQLVAIKASQKELQARIWTALPAIVDSFNAAACTVSAQPTIQAQVRQPNGTWLDTTITLCTDCPVMFPGAGGFVSTFPLAKGDEGLLVFSARCIDSWWQSGGIQKQADLRMHDLSDGFFFPAMLSQPNVPSAVSTTEAQLRNKTGTLSVGLDPTTEQVNILAPGGLWVNGVMVVVP
jgi:hypothetical protein